MCVADTAKDTVVIIKHLILLILLCYAFRDG